MKKLLLASLVALSGNLFAQECMIGEMKMFAGNFAPRNWALADGQLLDIGQHQALFSILGTTYGGDGTTTFALPDMRGRVAMHAGQGTGLSDRRLGEQGGAESKTLTRNEIPHKSGQLWQAEPNGHLVRTSMVGGLARLPVNLMQPYTTVNYIICLQGLFPGRN